MRFLVGCSDAAKRTIFPQGYIERQIFVSRSLLLHFPASMNSCRLLFLRMLHHSITAIREELFFHIDNSDASGDDERASKSESSAIPRSIRGSGQTYRETSPTGSLCSGASDRRDRFIDRATLLRPPMDVRSIHRSDTSGAS